MGLRVGQGVLEETVAWRGGAVAYQVLVAGYGHVGVGQTELVLAVYVALSQRAAVAVDLNDQLPREAGEVGDIRSDRMLSSEPNAELLAPDVLP